MPCLSEKFTTPNVKNIGVQASTAKASKKVQANVTAENPAQWKKKFEREREKNKQLRLKVKRLQSRSRALEKKITRPVKGFFSKDEATYLKKGSMRGHTWSSESILKGLKHRFACGKEGYEVLRKEIKLPYPSYRTLCE